MHLNAQMYSGMIHLEVYHEVDLTNMFVKSVLSMICQMFFRYVVYAVTPSARWPVSQLVHQPRKPPARQTHQPVGPSTRVACQQEWLLNQGSPSGSEASKIGLFKAFLDVFQVRVY